MLQHHTLGQSNSSYSLCHGCLLWCKAPNNFNSKLFSFRKEERAKRENNLLDLTYCVFIITPCAIFFVIFFVIFLWLHYLKYFAQSTICGDVPYNFLLLIFNLIPLLSETVLCIISILWNLLGASYDSWSYSECSVYLWGKKFILYLIGMQCVMFILFIEHFNFPEQSLIFIIDYTSFWEVLNLYLKLYLFLSLVLSSFAFCFLKNREVKIFIYFKYFDY